MLEKRADLNQITNWLSTQWKGLDHNTQRALQGAAIGGGLGLLGGGLKGALGGALFGGGAGYVSPMLMDYINKIRKSKAPAVTTSDSVTETPGLPTSDISARPSSNTITAMGSGYPNYSYFG